MTKTCVECFSKSVPCHATLAPLALQLFAQDVSEFMLKFVDQLEERCPDNGN